MKKINYIFVLLFVTNVVIAQFKTDEITIDQKIHGSLYQSEKESDYLAILIPGSGPTDRNGNQPMMLNNSLKYLAEDLAKNQVNAFTFDKAFLHHSDNSDAPILFEDMVEDVTLIIQHFHQKFPLSKIVLIGHSEGSLVGILVAQKQKVDYLISIAGAALPIDEIIVSQIEKQAPFLATETKSIFDELRNGKMVEDFNPLLVSIFNKDSQDFLRGWMKYNPQAEIKKVTAKTLIIQGTKDLQVTVQNANLLQGAKTNSELVLIENMNHVFKEIRGDEIENMGSYNQPQNANHPKLISSIVEFLKS